MSDIWFSQSSHKHSWLCLWM